MERGQRKLREGVVLSNKMNKTVTVVVTRITSHPFYGKVIKRKTKFKAHDEENACQIGDKVSIMECRPLSKDKRWRVVKILQKTQVGSMKELAIDDSTGK